MSYLEYNEYTSMGGSLDEATFNNLEFEAETTVNWYTFNRLKKDTSFPDELKRLMKYLVDFAEQKAKLLGANGSGSDSATGSMIASQSNDGVSVSYNVLSATELFKSIEGESEAAIKRYLQGVMNEAGRLLLYRGLYPGE